MNPTVMIPLYFMIGLFLACFVYIDDGKGGEMRSVYHLGFAVLFAFLWPLIVIFMVHKFWTKGGVLKRNGKEIYRREPKE